MTNEQMTVLYALRKTKIHWDEDKDWHALFVVLSLMRELKMMRVLDLLLMPGEFREVIMFTLKNGVQDGT